MDHSLCSIGGSSFSDIIDITEIETATFSDMKIISEKLDQEVDEDLVFAFNDISENEDKSEEDSESEDGDDHERNLQTDSSFTSERDSSLAFSAANPISDQRSNIEFEIGLTKEDSYNETEESDKNKLTSNLEDSQNLISDYQHEKNKLQEKVTALKSQLSSVMKMKDEIHSKFERSEFTIKLLEKQLNELNGVDHLSYDHHNSILEEMKLCHERDIQSYKENIKELQSKLNSKVKEVEGLALENCELQRKYQDLQMEKVKWVDQISEEFLAQKKCQLFLESGTIEEINRLKLQIHHLEEEKSRIERENSLLKESFFQRWARSLLLWQLQCLRRVSNVIGFPFF